MSGECDECGRHALECICNKVILKDEGKAYDEYIERLSNNREDFFKTMTIILGKCQYAKNPKNNQSLLNFINEVEKEIIDCLNLLK